MVIVTKHLEHFAAWFDACWRDSTPPAKDLMVQRHPENCVLIPIERAMLPRNILLHGGSTWLSATSPESVSESTKTMTASPTASSVILPMVGHSRRTTIVSLDGS